MEESSYGCELTDISNIDVLDVSNITFEVGEDITYDDNESYGEDSDDGDTDSVRTQESTDEIDMIIHEKKRNNMIEFNDTIKKKYYGETHGLGKKISYKAVDKKLKEYLGDIDYYLEEKKVENLREVELKTKIKVDKPLSNKLSYDNQKKLKSLNNKLSKVESKIGLLENEIKDLDNKLENNYDKFAKEDGFFDKYQSKKSQLNILMKDWELIQNDLSKLS